MTIDLDWSQRGYNPVKEEPDWEARYRQEGIEKEYWQKRSRYAEKALTEMLRKGNKDAERVLEEIFYEFIGG